MKLIHLFLLVLSATSIFAQEPAYTIRQLVEADPFSEAQAEKYIWQGGGEYFSILTPLDTAQLPSIVSFETSSGEPADTLLDVNSLRKPFKIDEFAFSPDEKLLLLTTQKESLYRHSFQARYHVYDIKNETLFTLSDSLLISYAQFSPDSRMIAYVRDHNLYYVRMDNLEEYPVTQNGRENELIHGSADWVYEEEFGMTQTYAWSPDSKKIAYISFDQTEVPEYFITLYDDPYPAQKRYKYPRAGQPNSKVTVSVYDIEKNKTTGMKTGVEDDIYIRSIQWTSDPGLLSIRKLNRLQNQIEILHARITDGSNTSILKESTKTWLDERSILVYLQDGTFLYSTDRDGNHHIYHHNFNGQLINQVTTGPWEVTQFYGVDEEDGRVYYASTEPSPLERHVYRNTLKGNRPEKLSLDTGYNSANFSPDFEYFILRHNSLENPSTYTLLSTRSSKFERVIETNSELKARVEGYAENIQFFSFRNEEKTRLNGYLVLPADFDSTRVYPLLMYVYGGPGSQRVLNTFNLRERGFHTYLAGKGYIVACVDNRGTGGRGRDFKNVTYRNLGRDELADQLATARFLSEKSFVDENNIGIWGKSYGGYMAALCLFNGGNIFKYGIALAPVTHWKYYDTIYTERYMQRPSDNPDGYEEHAPVNDAHRLDGRFLLIHGTADDNVHLQHSISLSESLKNANKPFTSIFYQNKDHALQGRNTRIHLYTSIEAFIMNSL